ncbi:SUKH-3 domain-containing protein, partial [Streptomyces sp. NPDC002454]
TGDWYLGPDMDAALTTLVTGARPARLSTAP